MNIAAFSALLISSLGFNATCRKHDSAYRGKPAQPKPKTEAVKKKDAVKAQKKRSRK